MKSKGFPGDSQERTTQTLVDLGDDLLEKTRTTLTPTPEVSNAFNADDQLQSARILFGEGFFEEAKKILHRVLVEEPSNKTAIQRLEEIRQTELKQILNSDSPARSRRKSRPQPAEESDPFDADEILQKLDHDLKLSQGQVDPVAILFKDSAGMQAFSDRVEVECLNASSRDRLDLGIAFLEMGLHELSMRQFRVAQRSAEHALPATALLAYTMILSGQAFEATLTLELILGDSEVRPDDQVEFIYLMGRAHEALQRNEFAVGYYREVMEHDPHYRDTRERSSRCETREKRALSKKP
ncbi:MAG: hypothetical protein H7222_04965 [Methylotenera sp.]|nr:hypothetical protein [Oligoflexia bacterium]